MLFVSLRKTHFRIVCRFCVVEYVKNFNIPCGIMMQFQLNSDLFLLQTKHVNFTDNC